jgi:hypothetical protein
MIVNIQDEDEDSFLRHWAERVWDRVQLAQMAAIEEQLGFFAMTAWRPMGMPPPVGVLLYTACEEGPVLMTVSELGDWRTSLGQPHKPPLAWMPAPPMPTISI